MPEEKSTVQYRLVQGHSAYRVGDDGSVWSRYQKTAPAMKDGRCTGPQYILGDDWRPLRLGHNRTGYPRAAIFDGAGRQVKRMVHLLMLEAFVGPRPAGPVACHANDIKTDNRLSNLRWDTPSSNWDDRRRNGRTSGKKGEQHPMAKLTESDVRDIRSLDARGIPSMALAEIKSVRASCRARTRKLSV